VSVILHVVVLLAMALLVTIGMRETERPIPIVASISDDEPFDETEIIQIEQPPDDQKIEEPQLDAAIDPGEIALGDVAVASTVAADMSELGAGGPLGDIGSLAGMELGTGLGGDGDGTGGTAGVTFFGAKTAAKSIVFIVDNSNSMTQGRFETALNELVRAVGTLGPSQKFSVIFYSDQAYGLFHPEKFPGLVPATDANKEKLLEWLYTVEMCLQTRGEGAMRMAIALEPDLINILGDGAFTDKATELLMASHQRKTVIQTFGMQVDPKGEKQLTGIATANGGKFHPVTVDPDAAKVAKANPISKHKTRGPVWGLSLPAEKKK
jgi:hypothetical protein